MIERRSNDGVDLEDGLGGAAGAVSAAVGGGGVVEGVEVIGAQATQRDLTDGGLDVAVDEPCVPVGGGGANLPWLVWDPGVGEVLAERDRPGRCHRCGVAFAVEWGSQLFGFGSVVANGVPASAFPSGERVEAVVGDDAEAVLALHYVTHPPSSTTSTPTRSSAGRVEAPWVWFSPDCRAALVDARAMLRAERQPKVRLPNDRRSRQPYRPSRVLGTPEAARDTYWTTDHTRFGRREGLAT